MSDNVGLSRSGDSARRVQGEKECVFAPLSGDASKKKFRVHGAWRMRANRPGPRWPRKKSFYERVTKKKKPTVKKKKR